MKKVPYIKIVTLVHGYLDVEAQLIYSNYANSRRVHRFCTFWLLAILHIKLQSSDFTCWTSSPTRSFWVVLAYCARSGREIWTKTLIYVFIVKIRFWSQPGNTWSHVATPDNIPKCINLHWQHLLTAGNYLVTSGNIQNKKLLFKLYRSNGYAHVSAYCQTHHNMVSFSNDMVSFGSLKSCYTTTWSHLAASWSHLKTPCFATKYVSVIYACLVSDTR